MPKVNLPAAICKLMADNNASNQEGMSAIMMALVIGLLDGGMSKEMAVQWLEQTWDRLEPDMRRYNQMRKH